MEGIRFAGLGKYAGNGFELGHPDDHIVVLKHNGEEVGKFNQVAVTGATLQVECEKHLTISEVETQV